LNKKIAGSLLNPLYLAFACLPAGRLGISPYQGRIDQLLKSPLTGGRDPLG